MTDIAASTPLELVLRDGTPAMIWPLLPTDGVALREAFARLSRESRRLRFLAPVVELDAPMLRLLVDEVDQQHHVALVLTALPLLGDEQPVAVGRLVQYADDPATAELAVTVADDWHARGAGAALAAALVARRPAEVVRLRTEVAADNAASLAMLHRLGPMTTRLVHPGVYEVEIDLEEQHVAALSAPQPSAAR